MRWNAGENPAPNQTLRNPVPIESSNLQPDLLKAER